MKEIVVVPYNPDWVQDFKLIESELLQIIQDSIIAIEHVGSTSVPGLYAKPIIDIDIVIDQTMFEAVKTKLKKIGYIHRGDLGIVGREAFGYENKEHLMKHHLYVSDVNSDELKRHLALRNFLLCNKEYREKYSIIKLEMAKRYPHDMDSYLEGKEPVILEIYEKCGLDITYKNKNNN